MRNHEGDRDYNENENGSGFDLLACFLEYLGRTCIMVAIILILLALAACCGVKPIAIPPTANPCILGERLDHCTPTADTLLQHTRKQPKKKKHIKQPASWTY